MKSLTWLIRRSSLASGGSCSSEARISSLSSKGTSTRAASCGADLLGVLLAQVGRGVERLVLEQPAASQGRGQGQSARRMQRDHDASI